MCIVNQKPMKRFKHLSNFVIHNSLFPIFCILVAVCAQTPFLPTDQCKIPDYYSLGPMYNSPPTIFIGILVHNKSFALPYFLHGLESQHYPKNRITIQFYLDHTTDNSECILSKWFKAVRNQYHQLHLSKSTDTICTSDDDTCFWTANYCQHVAEVRQNLLNKALDSWTNIYLSIDPDVILINPFTLKHFVHTFANARPDENIVVLAPMLQFTDKKNVSNFVPYMYDDGVYLNIIKRENRRLHLVKVVSKMFFVNLQLTVANQLIYRLPESIYQQWPYNMIIFGSYLHHRKHIPFHVDNTDVFGYTKTFVDKASVNKNKLNFVEHIQLQHLKLEASINLEDTKRIVPSPHLVDEARAHWRNNGKLGLDEIYCINLRRRPYRKRKMQFAFDELGIDVQFVDAVDGKELSAADVSTTLEIRQLDGYVDPYSKRPMTYGEVGCFLSHYYLWQKMLQNNYTRILIFEDDVRFSAGFIEYFHKTVEEADKTVANWELLYVGRKQLMANETAVPNSNLLFYAGYSHWTIGYVLTLGGAKKLVGQNPLDKLVPVDEYLPIMSNQSTQTSWSRHFHPKDLVAVASRPVLIEPEKYTSTFLYVSDTEDSIVLFKSKN